MIRDHLLIVLFGMMETNGCNRRNSNRIIRFVCLFVFFSACIDTTQQGDLDQCKPLTNYIDSHECSTFGAIGLSFSSFLIHICLIYFVVK